MGSKDNRYGYIDSLRGISAVFVIVGHCISDALKPSGFLTTTPTELAAYQFIDTFFDLGKIGVIIFFCVSGYLIPNSLRTDRPAPIKRFFISRVFRLYPAYWASIPFAILALYYMQGQPISFSMVTANLTMLQQFMGIKNIQSLYWTLQIEIIFYFICVSMFFAGFLSKNIAVFSASLCFIFLALVMAGARYFLEIKLPVAVPLSLAVMFGANLYRRYQVDHDAEAGKYAIWCVALFALAILPICLLAYNFDSGFGETWYRYFIAYVFSISLFFIFTYIIRVESKYSTYLGLISYSLYLFGTIARVLSWTFLASFVGSCPTFVAIVIALLSAILASTIVYYAIEKPFIEMGRKLSAGPPVAQAAP